MEIRGYRIFYLDPEEDINSLLAELGNSPAQKMALVVHRRSNIFNSRINIQLLERYVKEWKKELVFISPEERLIRLVLESNFKIYPDTDALEKDDPITDFTAPLVTSLPTEALIPEVVQAKKTEEVGTQDVEWEDLPMIRTRRRESRWGNKVFAILFACAVLVGLGWFYFNFPIVTVEVSPTVQKLEKQIQVVGESGLEQIRLGEAKIPLHNFKSYDVKAEVTLPTTGRKKIGFTRAEGSVTMFNNSSKSVTVPEGTVLKANNGIKFKTIEAVTVPPAKTEYKMKVQIGSKAGEAEVGIVALEAGSHGNVGAGRIDSFDGKNQGLHVVNLSAIAGGSDKEEMIVSQKDLDTVMAQLDQKLKDLTAADLTRGVTNDYLVLKDTLQFEISGVEINHNVDDNASEITAKGKMVASGYLLMKEDLRIITRETFLADLPGNFQLFSNDIMIEELNTQVKEPGKAQVVLKANALVRASLEPTQIAELLKGQTVDAANGFLGKMKEIKYFRILAGEKTRIPRFTFAIRVVVREPENDEKGSI